MKRATINRFFAVTFAVAVLCVPALLTDPINTNAAVSSNVPNVSSNVPSDEPSDSDDSGDTNDSNNSGASGSSESAAVVSVTSNTMVIGNSRVTSTIGGIHTATAVTGTVITTPKDVFASAIGLSQADLKAGTNVRSYICNNNNAASKAALSTAAAEAGKTVAGYVNMDIYSITKKGVVTKITTASEPVAVTFGLPARLTKGNHSFSVIAIDKDGKVVVMDDVDTNAKTITINTKVFGAYSIVY